jgi:glycerol uptake facilitator-like aquaporin
MFSAVYATKPVSGGHLNPALTLATTVSGHMHWVRTATRTVWASVSYLGTGVAAVP